MSSTQTPVEQQLRNAHRMAAIGAELRCMEIDFAVSRQNYKAAVETLEAERAGIENEILTGQGALFQP